MIADHKISKRLIKFKKAKSKIDKIVNLRHE